MIVVVLVQGDQMSVVPDGCDDATALQMLTAAAQALQQKLTDQPPAPPPAAQAPPRPALYLPNGHGVVPARPPGGL